MFKRLLSVGGFTLLSRITGFIRDMLMAWTLGKGVLSDAFIVAFMFPNYFRAIFGEGTINPAFLPRYAALHARGEHEAAALFGDRIFSWQMAAQILLLLAALAAMPLIVHALAPGFNPTQMALTVELSRITFPYLILTLVAVQLSAMLNAIEKFWAAAAWSNFLNVAMIGTLLASHWFPNAAFAAAWGVLIGGLAQLFFMLWASARDGLSLRIAWPRWTPEVKEFFKAFGAVTFGAASVVIAPFIDTVIASLLPTGSRTALYYADRINQLPLGVLGIALGTVLLPAMSARLAINDRAGSDSAQNQSAALSLMLTLPFAAVFVLIPDTIMRAIFAHGAFDNNAAALSAIALATYGVGLPAMALTRIVASTFYARHDTMTPARATVAAIAANIALKVVFVWGLHLGIAGIALGTSFGAWINVAILTWQGRRHSLLAIDPGFRRAVIPIILAGIAAGAGAYAGAQGIGLFAAPTMAFHDEIMLAAAALLGCVLYGAVILNLPALIAAGQIRAMRLFVALALTDAVAQTMFMLQSGAPSTRWQTREQLHLTLRFIGEVDGHDAANIDDVLSTIEAPPFALTLKGVGEFGGRNPRALWAGVSDPEPVIHLQKKIERALQRIGMTPEERKFTPHITLARLRGASPAKVIEYLADHALYASAPFNVTEFALYSSHLTPGGSVYTVERSYGLAG